MPSSPKDILTMEKKDAANELNNAGTVEDASSPAGQPADDRDRIIEEQMKEISALKEQVAYLINKLYGKKSEKSSDFPDQMKLSDFCDAFNEAELTQDPDAQEEVEFPDEETGRKKRKAKVINNEKYAGLPEKKEYLDIPEKDRVCPKCGTELEYIGEEYVRTELHFVPARMYKVQVYSKNYGCPKCKLGEVYDPPTIVKGRDGRCHALHGMISASTLAWILYQKYFNSMPLERQRRDWEDLYGIKVSSATFANWVIWNTEELLVPFFEHLHKEYLKREFKMADETPVQVLHEPGKKPESESFMWVYRTGEDGLPPIVLYKYEESRGGYHAADFLENCGGYLMCDGFSGYNALKNVKRCSCWAHVRRYLLEAIPKGKKDDYSQPAVQGLLYIEKLFLLERQIHTKHQNDFESIRKARLEKERPVLDALWSWLDKQDPVKGTRMFKAVIYMRNRKQYLETYLEDGRCSFSNNLTEQKCKSFVIGRKNWLFSTSVKGADASSVVYSIAETARTNGVNVYYYFRYLLDKISKAKKEEMDKLLAANPAVAKKELAKQVVIPEEILESLVPWNQSVRTAVENLYIADLDDRSGLS